MPCKCKKGKLTRYTVHLGDATSKKVYITKFGARASLPDLISSVKFMLGRYKVPASPSVEEYKTLHNLKTVEVQLSAETQSCTHLHIEKE